MTALHFKSAVEIAKLIRERKASAVEVLEHFLARVAKYNPKINAIVWTGRRAARASAPPPLMPLSPRARYGGRCTACR